ncbi:MAG: hypothetical protein KGI37_10455 [Alphaproteobacteria bacterium]|nr:hypothetical protein [Alphaproteobacteria bacterium]
MKTGIEIGNPVSLNKFELISVRSLVEYAAHSQKASAVIVHEALIDHFGVQDITQIPSRSYDDAVRFLVDIKVDMLLN